MYPVSICLKKRSFDIVVDGNPAEWGKDVPVLELGKAEQVYSGKSEFLGEKDLSGRFKLVWDDDALYISGYVKDERLVGSTEPKSESIWNGDNVEIALELTRMPCRCVCLWKHDWQFGLPHQVNSAQNRPCISGGEALTDRKNRI